MKLNKLRLLGFKSFVEPTDFLIEHGLTGVVGPNGCGKSNLVEALRWVMARPRTSRCAPPVWTTSSSTAPTTGRRATPPR